MTDRLGIVVQLKSGLWVDESLVGCTFTFSCDDLEIKMALPGLSSNHFFGFHDLIEPQTEFPPQYQWSNESDLTSHFWGYMSDHNRDEHGAVIRSTFCIQKFVVTTTIPGSCENLIDYRAKFEGVWEDFWNKLRINIEVLSFQDVENGSNLDTASKETYVHHFNSGIGAANSHLVSELGAKPLIQAKPINYSEYIGCFKAAVEGDLSDVSALMLRDARLKYNNMEYKLCLIHAATALEIKLMRKIKTTNLPKKFAQDDTFKLSKASLGTLVGIWNVAGEPGFQSRVGNLVEIRNDVIHRGAPVNAEHALKMYQVAITFN